MSSGWLRTLEHLHGHLGWLATAALFHPALALGRRRHMLAAAAGATGLASLTALLGVLLYPAYRSTVKGSLFAASPHLGWAFERKEHLATGAITLAWVGLVAHVADARRRRGAPPRHLETARVAYGSAAAMALIAAIIGTLVAIERSF